MEQFIQFYDALYQQMEVELTAIKEGAEDYHLEAERGIFVVRRYLQEMKRQITDAGFINGEQEVHFFRYIKPRFYSRLIYFLKVAQILYRKPEGGRKAILHYLQEQQRKIGYFFKKYEYLYLYCRSNDNSLDTKLFLRGQIQLLPGIAFYGIDTDPSFTTGYDFILAKMQANTLLDKFLEEELIAIKETRKTNLPEPTHKRLFWTASKAALIELIYALQSVGVLDHGTAALGDIAGFFEAVFKIKLGNYYRVFQEIRIRKKSRTQFLDEMKERLIQKMDYTDENPHLRS